jgi:hypothetical protein
VDLYSPVLALDHHTVRTCDEDVHALCREVIGERFPPS